MSDWTAAIPILGILTNLAMWIHLNSRIDKVLEILMGLNERVAKIETKLSMDSKIVTK